MGSGSAVSVPLQGGRLLRHGRDLLILTDGEQLATPPLSAYPAAGRAPPVMADAPVRWRLRVACGDRRIALVCHVPGLRWLRPRLLTLRPADKGRRQHLLELRPHPDGVALYSDGALVEVAESPLHVAGLVYARLVELAMLPDRPLLVAHAAGLIIGGRPMLLAAASGGGKSCLATALTLRGATLLSDDTVGIARGGDLFGLPVTLRLRSGGWDLLRSLLPAGLPEPAYRRGGTTGLAPQTLGPVSDHAGPPAAIILLRRRTGQAPTLTRLTSALGLQALAGAGATLAGQGDTGMARALATWADATPFLVLDYDGLAAGAATLEALAMELPA